MQEQGVHERSRYDMLEILRLHYEESSDIHKGIEQINKINTADKDRPLYDFCGLPNHKNKYFFQKLEEMDSLALESITLLESVMQMQDIDDETISGLDRICSINKSMIFQTRQDIAKKLARIAIYRIAVFDVEETTLWERYVLENMSTCMHHDTHARCTILLQYSKTLGALDIFPN